MAKYIVSVVRTGYGILDLEIDANSEEEAVEIALDNAGGELFSQHNSEYEVNGDVIRVDQIVNTKSNKIIVNGIEMTDCAGLHHDD